MHLALRMRLWWRDMRLRPVFLSWPVGEYVLPHEFAREFYICFILIEYRWFALDHDFAPAMRLRLRFLHFGREPCL